MHRIDDPTAVADRFNGNPAIQSPTTKVKADWLNDVQENLCEVVEGAGLTLVKGEGGQLLAALEVFFDQIQPIGALVGLDGPCTSPRLCELNTEYLKADYPRLVAYYTAQGRLIAGSDADHFKTPDYQGLFGRVMATDDTVDPDGPRDEGSTQLDAFKSHSHLNNPTPSNSEGGSGYIVTGASGTGEPLTAWSTGLTGGLETRPRNFAYRLMIRGR